MNGMEYQSPNYPHNRNIDQYGTQQKHIADTQYVQPFYNPQNTQRGRGNVRGANTWSRGRGRQMRGSRRGTMGRDRNVQQSTNPAPKSIENGQNF